MLKLIKDKINIFGITKYNRILNYIDNLEDKIDPKSTKEDTKITLDLKELIEDRIKRLKKLYLIGYIFYFGIYFSFISFFFSDFFLLTKIKVLVSKLIGFFGTTTFILGIFFINKIKELYYQDLNLLASHLISIYDKNMNNKSEVFNENEYNTFINFFKKRGF